jgi:hypothetical protein
MNKSFFKEFLSFDKMITPTIIKVVYYILLVVSILTSLGIIITGFNMPFGGGLQVFLGLISLVLSPLFVRVYCEILIIVFKINEKLYDIDKKLGVETIKPENEESNIE